MSTQEHERLAMLAFCGVIPPGEIEGWLWGWSAANPGHELELHDILSSSREDRPSLFVSFVRDRLAFDILGARGAVVASRVLGDLCGSVLRGGLSVPKLGDIVQSLDQNFIDAKVAYPEGLHDLWNAFDWCDESWTLENQPWLPEVLREFEAKLGSAAAG